MPDKCEPSWIRSQDSVLSDYNLGSSEHDKYKIHLTDISGQTVYDDVDLSHITSDVAIHLQIYNEQESDLFFVLNPDDLTGDSNYRRTNKIESSDGCSVLMKRDREESICDVCKKNVPSGSRLVAFTGGTVSSEMHCSCWARMIESTEQVVMENSKETVSRLI